MAAATRLSIAAWDLALEAVLGALDGGTVDIYDGQQPATGDADPDGPPLATLKLSPQAFQPSAQGVKMAHPIASGTALRNGLATWFRAKTLAGVPIIDGSAGTIETDMVLNSAQLTEGSTVSWSTWAVSRPGARPA